MCNSENRPSGSSITGSIDDKKRLPGNDSGSCCCFKAADVASPKPKHKRREVAHLIRVSVMGELSGAIAHEINQPREK